MFRGGIWIRKRGMVEEESSNKEEVVFECASTGEEPKLREVMEEDEDEAEKKKWV